MTAAKKKPTAAERAATYARGRLRLILQLGGVCADCGNDNHLELEFHHKVQRTWTARHTSRWVRLARYRREAARGEVELLCGPCNKKQGRPSRQTAEQDEPIPC